MKSKNTITKAARLFIRHKKACLLAGLILLGAGTIGIVKWQREMKMRPGLAYVQQQDNASLDAVVDTLQNQQQARFEEEVANGEISMASVFEDAVFMGDSRVRGFADYGYLPWARTLAFNGAAITDIHTADVDMEAMHPAVLCFAYGINDLVIRHMGLEEGDPDYADTYEQEIDTLLAVVPDAHVIINSIIPPAPTAWNQHPELSLLEDYNASIKALCEKRGWIYVDNSALAQNGYADIYTEDGFHFQEAFYEDWARNIMESAAPVLAGQN